MRSSPASNSVFAIAIALAVGTADAATATHDRELVLAGGSLHLCSSLALRDCGDGADVRGANARGESQYRIDAGGIAALRDMRLAAREGPDGDARIAWLEAAGRATRHAALSRSKLVEALRNTCVESSRARPCMRGQTSPWERLDDATRAAVLSAFEVPQLDASGMRRRERASLAGSRHDAGPAVLRTFVERAAERSPDRRPRIAVVTASAQDSFDPVDVYLDALQQAGADAQWWPIDGALAAALRNGGDCDALPALRREVLQQAGRERVFPDLAQQQLDACRDGAALATLPDRIQGVSSPGETSGGCAGRSSTPKARPCPGSNGCAPRSRAVMSSWGARAPAARCSRTAR